MRSSHHPTTVMHSAPSDQQYVKMFPVNIPRILRNSQAYYVPIEQQLQQPDRTVELAQHVDAYQMENVTYNQVQLNSQHQFEQQLMESMEPIEPIEEIEEIEPAQNQDICHDHNYGQQDPQNEVIVNETPIVRVSTIVRTPAYAPVVSRKREANGVSLADRRMLRSACIKSWKSREKQFPVPMMRPIFSYKTLCIFAIINSPERCVTPSEVYSFLLHHFPYYRYATNNWKNSVRNALSKSQNFEARERPGYSSSAYYVIGEVRKEDLFKQAELRYIREEDPRGEEFYKKIMEGNIGLPRQLFYHVVANDMPFVAGPENSALFYHMLAIKHIPDEDVTIFREYYTPPTGNEPMHCERHFDFNSEYTSRKENLTSFGAAMVYGAQKQTITQDDIELFHKSVEKYFLLQRLFREHRFENWATPHYEVVHQLFDHVRRVEEQQLAGIPYESDEFLRTLVPVGPDHHMIHRNQPYIRSDSGPLQSAAGRVRPIPLPIQPYASPTRPASVPIQASAGLTRPIAVPTRPSSVPVRAKPAPLQPVPLAPVAPVAQPDFVQDENAYGSYYKFKATDTLSTLNGVRSPMISAEAEMENLLNNTGFDDIQQEQFDSLSPLHEFFPDLTFPQVQPKPKRRRVTGKKESQPAVFVDPANINLF